MKLSHFFLPHPETHKKAHLISTGAILVYILIFLVLQFSFSFLTQVKPGVLGISSNVDQQALIELTNKERAKSGLSELVENEQLNKAALEKAKNMFEEDYWAHYSPSGKDPWGFIQGAGYRFSYAGENLARNFYQSDEVVQAWMNSPTHKENILNSHYQEIGIAVLEGTLKGEKTTLIVQEFGRPVEALANLPEPINNKPVLVEEAISKEAVAGESSSTKVAGFWENISLDPYYFIKVLGLSFIGMLIGLIGLDLFIIKRRQIERISSRHIPHLALLSTAGGLLLNFSPGAIL